MAVKNNAINAPKPFAVGIGGTGDATLTDRSVLIGRGTSPVEFAATQANSNAVLMSQGAAVNPAFTTTGDAQFNTIKFTSALPAGTVGGVIQNQLPLYSYGTWVPILKFGGSVTGITYASQQATYMAIGNLCFISLNIILTNKGAEVGNAEIYGLPFKANASYAGQFAQYVVFNNLTLTATYTSVYWQPSGANYYMTLAECSPTVGGIFITNTYFANTSSIAAVGCYLI